MRNFHEQSVSALDFSPASSDSQTFISPLLPTLHLLADSSVPERARREGAELREECSADRHPPTNQRRERSIKLEQGFVEGGR